MIEDQFKNAMRIMREICKSMKDCENCPCFKDCLKVNCKPPCEWKDD